jgi:hypothetical protein
MVNIDIKLTCNSSKTDLRIFVLISESNVSDMLVAVLLVVSVGLI